VVDDGGSYGADGRAGMAMASQGRPRDWRVSVQCPAASCTHCYLVSTSRVRPSVRPSGDVTISAAVRYS